MLGSRSIDKGTSYHPVPTPGPRDNHPFLFEFHHTGRMALCPNVFSTGSGPKPSHYVLLSFGGGTTIRCGRICQLFLTVAYWRSGVGPPKDSNSGTAD